jgi:hypothetical protein
MSRTPVRVFALGWLVRLMLGLVTRRPAESHARRRPSGPGGGQRGPAARGEARALREPEAPAEGANPRRPLTAFMLACALVGVPVMVLFESAPTRIIGVLSLFGFIISGVFLIADPSALGRVDE